MTRTMGQSEVDVLDAAQALFDQRQYQKLRNYIWSNHGLCTTDPVKVQLLHLWEDSLYQEFVDARSPNPPGSTSPADIKSVLSSSMRYKLRKKHPCPIELEQELRVKNARLPKPVHDGLNDWLKKHTENPYPNKVEKEALASKLGITPQQVNRWFIQRRKMLRIRGHLYLGRQYETEHKEEMKRLAQQADDDYDEDYDDEYDRYEGGRSPLLEKILTGARASSPQQIVSKSLWSGGTVEVLGPQTKLALLAGEAAASGHLPLTPPPSVSGEVSARSTPPHADLDHAPLDLSKSSLVPTPKTSPVSWRSYDDNVCYDLSMKESRLEIAEEEPNPESLDEEERIAVNALLTLAKCH